MFFSLNGSIYHNGDCVQISDIGADVLSRNQPGDTLVCNTTYVNTNCCRNSDNNYNGPIGDWFDPNNSKIARNGQDRFSNNIFVRIGYDKQVRLVSRGNVTGPLGLYTCAVPDMYGEIHKANIFIVLSKNKIIKQGCSIFVIIINRHIM